ncbi:MAG: hypothetical protein II841_04065 [Bacteroidales bacterium]|nr:hypothetical protein [Bacteroidales bacterium]
MNLRQSQDVTPVAKSGIFAVFVRFHVTPDVKSRIFAVFVRFHVTSVAKSGIFAVFARFHGWRGAKSGIFAVFARFAAGFCTDGEHEMPGLVWSGVESVALIVLIIN